MKKALIKIILAVILVSIVIGYEYDPNTLNFGQECNWTYMEGQSIQEVLIWHALDPNKPLRRPDGSIVDPNDVIVKGYSLDTTDYIIAEGAEPNQAVFYWEEPEAGDYTIDLAVGFLGDPNDPNSFGTMVKDQWARLNIRIQPAPNPPVWHIQCTPH